MEGNSVGVFVYHVTNLEEQTTYYYRAYMICNNETIYGDQKSFKTAGSIDKPTVVSKDVTNITQTTATCGGNVTSNGGANVTARGVCWSASQNPTITNSHTTDGSGTGSFTSNLTGLTANTTYYVRAYATNEKGTSYGEEKSFTTEAEETTGSINGHEYVDLGLPSGLKWATCNVGASSPEDYGDYYAWGETETKSTYTSDNCATYGVQMNDISGNAQYDVARKKWGGSWRMPTRVEMEELVEECTWQWTIQNGVNGCKVTGPNGNSIFLPAAGYRAGSSLYRAGEHGDYWSSTPYESYSDYAYTLLFNSSGQGVDWDARNFGLSVRPVSE